MIHLPFREQAPPQHVPAVAQIHFGEHERTAERLVTVGPYDEIRVGVGAVLERQIDAIRCILSCADNSRPSVIVIIGHPAAERVP